MYKLMNTLRIAYTLVMARTFGTYIHSGWNNEFEYCKYEYKGEVWVIPLTSSDQ